MRLKMPHPETVLPSGSRLSSANDFGVLQASHLFPQHLDIINRPVPPCEPNAARPPGRVKFGPWALAFGRKHHEARFRGIGRAPH